LVKFECCNKYWPCHRCHNNESTCGRTKLKSRDTTMVKCVECGKEQQVTNKMLKLFTHICDIFSTAWKSITKLVIFQSFVTKCCKMRII
jgi:uncharacterized CHY-type Zn-finger protein